MHHKMCFNGFEFENECLVQLRCAHRKPEIVSTLYVLLGSSEINFYFLCTGVRPCFSIFNATSIRMTILFVDMWNKTVQI